MNKFIVAVSLLSLGSPACLTAPKKDGQYQYTDQQLQQNRDMIGVTQPQYAGGSQASLGAAAAGAATFQTLNQSPPPSDTTRRPHIYGTCWVQSAGERELPCAGITLVLRQGAEEAGKVRPDGKGKFLFLVEPGRDYKVTIQTTRYRVRKTEPDRALRSGDQVTLHLEPTK